MNQQKIGSFLKELRKEKNMTQEELASVLGISKNAVSKWERGICLMDMSLLKPLSIALGASINEILSGEHIKSEDFIDKSNETIIKLAELIDLKTMHYGIIGMALFFIILVFISMSKDESASSLVSLLCAYNGITYTTRYKIKKENTDLVAGILFIVATILNTIVFIIS